MLRVIFSSVLWSDVQVDGAVDPLVENGAETGKHTDLWLSRCADKLPLAGNGVGEGRLARHR